MIDVDNILEQLPPGIYSLRDRVAQRMFDEVDAAAADETRRAVAPIVAAVKAQGAPYALDAWPNEDEL